MAEIKFEIKETTGILSESAKGWKKELNLISWNDKEAKYDIREWDAEHKKMGKGVTLSLDEYKLLVTFENGEVELFDMNPYLDKGIFRELKDLSLFKSAKVNFDTVEWQNEADIDPETLYEDGILFREFESPSLRQN